MSFQRHLVADRNVLPAFELDRPILVEDQSGQRRSGLDAFDDDDRDAVVRVMQYAVDHGISCQRIERPAARSGDARRPQRARYTPPFRLGDRAASRMRIPGS